MTNVKDNRSNRFSVCVFR